MDLINNNNVLVGPGSCVMPNLDLSKTFIDNRITTKVADRYNEGKPQWSMVDFKSLEPMVRVLEYGAKKYSRDNWKLGLPTLEICDSLMRHLIAFMNGEDKDPESGLDHLGHISCNVMFLNYVMREKPELDTRKNE